MTGSKHLPRVGPYHIVEAIGSGGMAEVYRGTRYDDRGWVAVKLIHQSMVRQYLERFRRGDRDKDQDNPLHMFLDEIIIHQDLDHPNVVKYLEEGHHRCVGSGGRFFDQPFLVMEYVHGRSLDAVFEPTLAAARGFGELPPRWMRIVARIVEQAARGLHHLHELKGADGQPKRAVHRDIAPKNILVGYDGGVKVTDFGLVTAEQRITGTMLGILKGTPAYFSPEQTFADVELDRRSDIFSLGIVLWEMTLLRRLFRRDVEMDTILAVRAAEVPTPSAVCSWYPRALEEVVVKALAADRDDRYSDALELAEALDEFLAIGKNRTGARDISGLMHALFAPTPLPPPDKPSSFVLDPDYNFPTLEDAPVVRGELDSMVHDTTPEGHVTQRMVPPAAMARRGTPKHPIISVELPSGADRPDEGRSDLGDEPDTLDDHVPIQRSPALDTERNETIRMFASALDPGNERYLTERMAPLEFPVEEATGDDATEPHEPSFAAVRPASRGGGDESLTDLSKPMWGIFNRIRRLLDRK